LHLPLGDRAPDEINVIVEIPENRAASSSTTSGRTSFASIERSIRRSTTRRLWFCAADLASTTTHDVLVLVIEPTFPGASSPRDHRVARDDDAAKRTTRFSGPGRRAVVRRDPQLHADLPAPFAQISHSSRPTSSSRGRPPRSATGAMPATPAGSSPSPTSASRYPH